MMNKKILIDIINVILIIVVSYITARIVASSNPCSNISDQYWNKDTKYNSFNNEFDE